MLSEVKNKGSGWKDEKFNWGARPTLLKKMAAEFQLVSNKDFQVYELNENGKRGKKLKPNVKNNVLTFSAQESNSPWFEITY